MDDEPMWDADHVVASTPGSAITILETANEFSIKDLAETMIWNMLKKTCGELIRHSEALVNTLFAQELIMENYHEQNIREFSLSQEKKNKLVSVLKKHKQAFAWKTTNIPGICPLILKLSEGELEFSLAVIAMNSSNSAKISFSRRVPLIEWRILIPSFRRASKSSSRISSITSILKQISRRSRSKRAGGKNRLMKVVRSSSQVLIVPSLSSSNHVFASSVSDRGNIIRRTASFSVSLYLNILQIPRNS
ncbi:hypothetical protein Tco_1198494 [Tanacetum coccineum]